jgi:molybdate/tungstate transport system ATP-binding protein
MLELRSINKKFGSFAISNISMDIKEGEYMVLVGPSGVGKSILLEIIAGLIEPDSGQVFFNNKDISFNPPESRGFAVVYQDYVLFPHLTVQQNIAYGLKAAGTDSQAIKERLRSLAQMLHIEPLLCRKPATLSGGEQQRVALARALAIEPQLLLLDEPLSALDVNTRLRLRKELKRINKELKITVLHVTHDPEEAMELGDRICVMLDSQIRQTAPRAELFREPSDPDVARFLGMRNILPVVRDKGEVCLAQGQRIHVDLGDDSMSHIWIKPEEILLSREPFESSARNQFRCEVIDLDHYNPFMAVHVSAGEMILTALITYASFKELKIEIGVKVYATFKSSAIHCF